MRVHLDWPAAGCSDHHRHKRRGPRWHEQTAGVLEVEAVCVLALCELRDPLLEIRLVVNRADRIGEREHDLLGAGGAGETRERPERRNVVGRMHDLEAADAVGHHGSERHRQQLVARRLPRYEACAGGEEREHRFRHCRRNEPQPLPRILAVVANRDSEMRARCEVERVKANPVDDRRDGKDVARRKTGSSPKALIAVADGRVDEFDGAGHASACSSQLVVTLPDLKRLSATSRASSARFVLTPATSTSASALVIVARASSRSGPWAMSLASSES